MSLNLGIKLATAGLGLGLAGYAGARFLRQAPLSEETNSVGIVDGKLSVHPKVSAKLAGWGRVARGLPHVWDTIEDARSHTNEVLKPRVEAEALPSDQLRIRSWNLHKGQSPDQAGARPQLDAMVQELRESPANVNLLQEVAPWDAQDLVDGTGMKGYYTHTTPFQGNMILVHPELKVTNHERHRLDPSPDSGGRTLLKWISGKGPDPRAYQSVTVELSGGRSAEIWNTHLAVEDEGEPHKAREMELLLGELGESDSDLVIGGGDLNIKPDHPAFQQMEAAGYSSESASTQPDEIDWLVARGGAPKAVYRDHFDGDTRVSDHPSVVMDAEIG